jgi:hypothetical protein
MKNYKVLTVRQPWAHLIIAGIKPIENRVWQTSYRGTILIHAGQSYDRWPDLEREFEIDPKRLVYGAVIGSVELIDIVTEHPSPFFFGPYGWVLQSPRPIDPVPLRGQLRLFNAQLKLKIQKDRK